MHIASLTIASNAVWFSGLMDSKKRDCVSLNNSDTGSPDIFTSAPSLLAPNKDSAKATAKPPSERS